MLRACLRAIGESAYLRLRWWLTTRQLTDSLRQHGHARLPPHAASLHPRAAGGTCNSHARRARKGGWESAGDGSLVRRTRGARRSWSFGASGMPLRCPAAHVCAFVCPERVRARALAVVRERMRASVFARGASLMPVQSGRRRRTDTEPRLSVGARKGTREIQGTRGNSGF